MNWVGGARSRVKKTAIQKQQQAFFAQHRSSRKGAISNYEFDRSLLNGSVSQDIASLKAASGPRISSSTPIKPPTSVTLHEHDKKINSQRRLKRSHDLPHEHQRHKDFNQLHKYTEPSILVLDTPPNIGLSDEKAKACQSINATSYESPVLPLSSKNFLSSATTQKVKQKNPSPKDHRFHLFALQRNRKVIKDPMEILSADVALENKRYKGEEELQKEKLEQRDDSGWRDFLNGYEKSLPLQTFQEHVPHPKTGTDLILDDDIFENHLDHEEDLLFDIRGESLKLVKEVSSNPIAEVKKRSVERDLLDERTDKHRNQQEYVKDSLHQDVSSIADNVRFLKSELSSDQSWRKTLFHRLDNIEDRINTNTHCLQDILHLCEQKKTSSSELTTTVGTQTSNSPLDSKTSSPPWSPITKRRPLPQPPLPELQSIINSAVVPSSPVLLDSYGSTHTQRSFLFESCESSPMLPQHKSNQNSPFTNGNQQLAICDNRTSN